MGKKKKAKLPLAYKPLGVALGWGTGWMAGLAFRKTWMALRHEEDAPDALDRRGEQDLPPAAVLVQGALFAMARSLADRAGAKAVERSTGVWPSGEKGGRD